MNTRDILIALASSVVGGLIVWVVQQLYLNRRERRQGSESKLVRSQNSERIVTGDIFDDMSPGKTIELMRETFGSPTKYYRNDIEIFKYVQVMTHSYLYMFRNAWIKITSKNNELIETLTVVPLDKSISTTKLFIPAEASARSFDDFKVWRGMFDYYFEHEIMHPLHQEPVFALRQSSTNSLYNYTYFGISSQISNDPAFDAQQFNPSLLVGEPILGICVALYPGDSFFIADYEIKTHYR